MLKIDPLPKIITITGADDRASANIANLLNDGRSSRQLRRLLLAIVALVVLFLLWTLLAQVDELAKARGEVQPVSRIQLVQSKEGGILTELLVEANEPVKAGQVIARFATTDVQKDLDQVGVRRSALQIDLELWGAVIEARRPSFSDFADQPVLVAEAIKRYVNELALNSSLADSKRTVLEQQRAALTGAQGELPAMRNQLNLALGVQARYQDGFARGAISAVRMAEAQEHAAEVERNLAQLQSRITELQKSIAVAQAALQQVRDEIDQKAGARRSELIEKIHELDAEMVALKDRHERTEVLAPVSGFIKQLPDTRAGAVIAPGGTVAELVPSEGGVVMEVLVSPRDIGFVRIGQTTLVKVDAFDFSRFGSVPGKVKRISPSVFRQEQTSATYYKVDIQLDKAYVGNDVERQLIPGMTGEADIVTGRKTVFQYLAKPVFIGVDMAFHER